MTKALKLVLVVVFALSAYHSLRDIFQIFHVNFPTSMFWHRPHQWCASYCDYATFPLDAGGMVVSAIGIIKGISKILIFSLLLLFLAWMIVILSP